jgi:putative membrane protein
MNNMLTFFQDLAAQWHGPGWGMGHGMMGWGWGMSWFGQIIMAAFWVAVIVGIVFLIRWVILSSRSGGSREGAADSAIEILKQRYARGEIDREEFEQKKKDLAAG